MLHNTPIQDKKEDEKGTLVPLEGSISGKLALRQHEA